VRKDSEQVIADLFGKPVIGSVLVTTKALRQVVNSFGCVNINIERDMLYTDKAQKLNIKLKKGRQCLNGQNFENYIRFRKGRGDNSDLARLPYAGQAVRALIDTAKAHPLQVFDAWRAIQPNILLHNLDWPDGVAVLWQNLRDFSTETSTLTAPGAYAGQRWRLNLQQLQAQFSATPQDLVVVGNAGGKNGAANTLVIQLRSNRLNATIERTPLQAKRPSTLILYNRSCHTQASINQLSQLIPKATAIAISIPTQVAFTGITVDVCTLVVLH
jgi:hypothetical protein